MTIINGLLTCFGVFTAGVAIIIAEYGLWLADDLAKDLKKRREDLFGGR